MVRWCCVVEKFQDEEREKEEKKEREEQERKRKEEEARTAKYRYNQINAHPRDAKLSFDKGSHIYTVGGRVMDSVTMIIEDSFPKFDKMKWAPITAKKKGMTEREVLDMWEKEGEESREKVIVNGLPAKTNQYGEKGNYPIGNLDNTPYWHYALQLSMYKYILEHNYGMEISRLRLGVFHPTYIKPYLLEMPYLEKEVNAIFSLRSEIIF